MDRIEDQISELPDDILVSIISLTGLKEAAKTSILSKRWRYLWAKQTHLDFNHLVVLPDLNPDINEFTPSADENSKYINWVNQVVGVHCSPCIDTFKVSFFLDRSDAHHIYKWIRFAILKKVKDLVLDLLSIYDIDMIGFDILQPSLFPGDGDISFLSSLHLSNINISGDVLEFLLSRCHLLERVHIRYSRTLVRLKVIGGQSCKLKQLTLYACAWLKELEIDSANLMYVDISYASMDLKLLINSTPALVDVTVVGYNEPNSILPQFFQHAGQISQLFLGILKCALPSVLLPTFSHLKKLRLLIDCQNLHIDHVGISTLLEACPALCEFKLEICWFCQFLSWEALELCKLDPFHWSNWGNNLYSNIRDDASVVPPRKNNLNLKLLHVTGFIGCDEDVNFILFFVDFACNLETIICDCTLPSEDYFIPLPESVQAARARAAKLFRIIPPRIHVEIII